MIRVSALMFCGMVALVAVLGGCMADETGDTAAQSDPLVLEGEAALEDKVVAEGDQVTEDGKAEGEIGAAAATTSFTRTCSGWRYFRRSDGAVTFAEASSCRMRNGSWTGYRSWSGVCWSDVSNNNGNIICFS